jgi:hypothetical protein
MKIFISGVCGFVGSELAVGLRAAGYVVFGCDNFSRAGSELNLPRLEAAGAAGPFLGAYAMLLLIGMFYLAIGCLASALTRNQIVAAIMERPQQQAQQPTVEVLAEIAALLCPLSPGYVHSLANACNPPSP